MQNNISREASLHKISFPLAKDHSALIFILSPRDNQLDWSEKTNIELPLDDLKCSRIVRHSISPPLNFVSSGLMVKSGGSFSGITRRLSIIGFQAKYSWFFQILLNAKNWSRSSQNMPSSGFKITRNFTSFLCRTTGSALICNTPKNSLSRFNDYIEPKSLKATESVWR